MKKEWIVVYNHKDGRSGTVEVTTELFKSGGFQYGNGMGGCICIGDYESGYDLRYNTGDLHRLMIEDCFGEGLVEATEKKEAKE